MKNTLRFLLIGVAGLLALASSVRAQLTPSADAYTNSAAPTTNYGAVTTLGVANAATTVQSSFLQFDLSSIPSGFTGANIAKASLKLYVNSVTTSGSFNVDYINGSWSEKTITANLSPALGATVASGVPLTAALAHDYILIDVTAALQAWLNGTQTNDGLALVANSPLVATFDSKENTGQSHAAELDVVFAGSGSGTITGVTAGSGLTGGGTSGNVTLSLVKTCASGQVLQWNGTSWVCANAGGSGTITGVTAGTDLTGGGTTGNVTLNLNTATLQTANDARYAQLGASNTFTQPLVLNTSGGTGVAASAASIGLQGSSAGTGVYGTTSGSGIGVFGTSNNATAVRGNDGGSGNGVVGASQTGTGVVGISISKTGVYGSTSAAGGSVNGVQGASTNATAVRGDDAGGGSGAVGTSVNGYGVFGASTNGFGVGTNSNVQQARGMGGWVKAMAYVNTRAAGGIAVTRCFNSQQSGAAVYTPPCGITLTHNFGGDNYLNFGFQVSDRFFSMTPDSGAYIPATAAGFPDANSVETGTWSPVCACSQDVSFYILVY